MAITKIQSESLNLADTYAFTGTVTGAGESNAPSFRVYRNATQSISSSSHTKIQFNTEAYDTASAFDNSSNYRYTIPSGHAGKWFFTCHGTIAQDTQDLNRLILTIRKNGSSLVAVEEDGAYDEYTLGNTISVCDNASVGDYYEVFIYQINSGSDALNLQANTMNGFSGFKISS
jgi:hypothetical protein